MVKRCVIERAVFSCCCCGIPNRIYIPSAVCVSTTQRGSLFCFRLYGPIRVSLSNALVVVFVVVLTLTHNSMQSVVAGQAPITLEWKKYLK